MPTTSTRLLLLLLLGLMQSGSARVTVESRVDGTDGVVVVTNRATAPLTAYLLDVIAEPCGPMQPRQSLRVTDSVISPDNQPLPPLESRTERLGTSPCNKTGTSTPKTASLRAAIFQDGSTSGDQASVAILLDHRRLILDQCEIILTQRRVPDAVTLPFPPIIDLARMTSSQLDRLRTALVDSKPALRTSAATPKK